jgi:DNA segregation ATPase FtsK/SpoIIIE, S-DNA-T family
VDPSPPGRELLPVIPVWMQTTTGIKREVGRYTRLQLHRAAVHGVRSPWYLLLALFWGLVGAVKLLGRWLHWWLFPVPASVHVDAAQEGHRAWKGIFKEHKQATWTRAKITVAVLVPVIVGGVLLWELVPWWVWLPPLVAVAVALLARAGHPADKPILRPAVITQRFRVLNADIVLRAYYAAGLGHADKPGMQVTFGSPMRREAEGSGVDVDLPYGKGLKDALDNKDGVASGLDVQVSQVFFHRDPSSIRRHHLWVADRDPLAVPVGRTPLLACKQTDIWKAAPLGLDERGQLVTLPLVWHSVLVGALPRQGKSWTARSLALFAALDPYVKLDVFDAAGKPDWRKFALVADSYAFGLTPNRDGLPPEILLATLQSIKADVQDRYNRLSDLPTSVCPEGKLTRKIARDPRYGMPVRVLVLDEFQEYYDLGKISVEIAEGLRFLVKVAPAAGVIPIWATQKPAGIGGQGNLGTMFNATRDNFIVRFALKTASYTVSEAVLGQGSYGMGLDSSALLPQYKGVGILHGATDASPTVRCYSANDTDAERILLAARALREGTGTLSGMAAGVEMETPDRDVLADVLSVFGGNTGLQWPQLAERLERHFPDRWKGVTAESISAELRDLKVASRDVKFLGRNLKGCYREDVQRAAGQ